MTSLYEQLLGNQATQPGDDPNRPRAASAPATVPKIVLGAAISFPAIVIVALRTTDTGWEWLAKQSRCFVLEDIEDRQQALRHVAWEVDAYVRSNGAQHIYVREPTGSGPKPAAGGTHRLFGMLQLASNARIHAISVHAINSWIRQQAPDLPRPTEVEAPRGFGKPMAFALHDRAIECAAFVTENIWRKNHAR